MDRIIRFTCPSYSGWGLLDGNMAYETSSLLSQDRGPAHPVEQVRLLAPCTPSKILGVGRNYHDHAKELGNPVPAEPLIFLKPPTTVIGPGDDIVYLPASAHISYEGELGVVIGKRAKNVRQEDADQYVLGYTCVNDVTARDLQKKDGQWARAKGFDTSCPVGPVIVRREDIARDDLRIRTYVDGELRQDGVVSDMIFSVDAIICHISQFMTLEAGDLIATGTPAGVGAIQPGSVVKVEIEGIGVLENRLIRV